MSDPYILRIGTRGSPLALVQARFIAAEIEKHSGGDVTGEIVTFTTSGDQLTTERLINSGGKGLFTKEIDLAVDEGSVDIAVHSLKDVPYELPTGQSFVAFPEREDVREGFLSPRAKTIDDLPEGAVIGTASLRREAQTLAARPDLKIIPFRGNVQTRLRKLEEGLADATYLAMAGLTRLGMAEKATPVPITDMLPAAGQGIIGVVAKDGMLRDEHLEIMANINHDATERAAFAERAFLGCLDGSCRTPIAAHGCEVGDTFHLKGEVLAPDGSVRWEAEASIPKNSDMETHEALGAAIGESIRESAGGELPQFEDE